MPRAHPQWLHTATVLLSPSSAPRNPLGLLHSFSLAHLEANWEVFLTNKLDGVGSRPTIRCLEPTRNNSTHQYKSNNERESTMCYRGLFLLSSLDDALGDIRTNLAIPSCSHRPDSAAFTSKSSCLLHVSTPSIIVIDRRHMPRRPNWQS